MKSFFKNNKRYLSIILLFIIVFLSRGTGEVAAKVLPSDATGETKDSHLVLGSSGTVFVMNNFIDSKKGDIYRLSFDLKIRPNENAYPDKTFEKEFSQERFKPEELQDSALIINLTSSYDHTMTVKELTGKNSPEYQKYEVYFQTDDVYTDCEVKKLKETDDNQIFLRNIQLSRLNSPSLNEAQKLQHYIRNDKVIARTDIPLEGNGLENIFTFRKSNQCAGQIFQADSDYLAGVSFRLDFASDFKGVYTLQLNEASLKDGKYFIDSKVITQQFINKENIAAFANKDQDGVFRFPLTSATEKGKYYFVGIDGSLAGISPLGGLKMYGTKDGSIYKSGRAVINFGTSDGKTEEIGNLYFQLHAASFVAGENDLLNGVAIEDLGGGKGTFTYQTKGDISDYLDITKESREKSEAYYSGGATNALANNNNSLIYQINTRYPIQDMIVDTETASGTAQGAVAMYSFDGQNWMNLDHQTTGQDINPNRFLQVIQGDGHNGLFIKITYNPAAESKDQGFSLVSLKLNGRLIIK